MKASVKSLNSNNYIKFFSVLPKINLTMENKILISFLLAFLVFVVVSFFIVEGNIIDMLTKALPDNTVVSKYVES